MTIKRNRNFQHRGGTVESGSLSGWLAGKIVVMLVVVRITKVPGNPRVLCDERTARLLAEHGIGETLDRDPVETVSDTRDAADMHPSRWVS